MTTDDEVLAAEGAIKRLSELRVDIVGDDGVLPVNPETHDALLAKIWADTELLSWLVCAAVHRRDDTHAAFEALKVDDRLRKEFGKLERNTFKQARDRRRAAFRVLGVDDEPTEFDLPERPRIDIVPRADELEVASLNALTGRGDIFVRDQRIVRALPDGELFALTASALRPVLSSVADFVVETEEAARLVQPPDSLCRSLVERGHYPGMRNVVGVTRIPILHPDGSVTAIAGYHEATGWFYAPGPSGVPTLIERPTLSDAQVSVARLLEVVSEFPFQTDADRAAWLALLFTVAARPAIRGNCPLFVASANQARLGKTTIVQLCELIVLGLNAPTIAWPKDEEELRKRVDALVFAGTPLALFDNVRGPIVGMALEAALTSTRYAGRILGQSAIRISEQRTVFAVSANGATFSGDMAPRTLPIRLFLDSPHPELRDFVRPDLLEWVQERRVQLLADALTAIRAYLLAGRPAPHKLEPWGSFESWSSVIRGALVWVGQADPVHTRTGIDEVDHNGANHDRLVALAAALFGPGHFTAGDFARKVDAADAHSTEMSLAPGWSVADAREVMADMGLWDRVAQRVDRQRLSRRALLEHAERPSSEGLRITREVVDGKAQRNRSGAPYWCIEETTKPEE